MKQNYFCFSTSAKNSWYLNIRCCIKFVIRLHEIDTIRNQTCQANQRKYAIQGLRQSCRRKSNRCKRLCTCFIEKVFHSLLSSWHVAQLMYGFFSEKQTNVIILWNVEKSSYKLRLLKIINSNDANWYTVCWNSLMETYTIGSTDIKFMRSTEQIYKFKHYHFLIRMEWKPDEL